MTIERVETNFDRETGHFLLQLRKEDVGLGATPVEFAGKTFQPKDEVHITIIGSSLGAELVAHLDREPGLVDEVREDIAAVPWSYSLVDEWYHVVREEGVDGKPYAESIIRMAQVPAIDVFYDRMRALTALEIAPRPTHVTLYIYGDDQGIGVATREEFEERVLKEVRPGQLTEVERN